MSARLISIIYFYLISAIAIVLLVIGVFHIISFTLNSVMYDTYPLRWGGGDRCAYINGSIAPAPAKEIPVDSTASPAPGFNPEEQKKQCEESLDAERKQHMVEDIRNAIAFTLIGGILFAIHFPIALRRSNSPK